MGCGIVTLFKKTEKVMLILPECVFLSFVNPVF